MIDYNYTSINIEKFKKSKQHPSHTQVKFLPKYKERFEYRRDTTTENIALEKQEIIDFIRQGQCVTKKDIMNSVGWGRGIKWTPYRRALMSHPNIFDTMDEYPKYIWRKSDKDRE